MEGVWKCTNFILTLNGLENAVLVLARRINHSCDGGEILTGGGREEEGVKGRLNFGGEERGGLGFFPVWGCGGGDC